MAKEKSGGKKFLIAFGIIALVAIIIVVVLLCIPPNTYSAIQMLKSSSESVFLTDTNDEDYQNFISFRRKISTNSPMTVDYADEMTNILSVNETIEYVYTFYNDNMLFTKNNKNLKKNYKTIKNNLKKANKSQDKMEKILKDAQKISEVGTYDTLRREFIKFRAEYVNYLIYNQKVFSALQSGYSGSLGKVIENNLASSLILSAVSDYISVITNSFVAIKNEDLMQNNPLKYQVRYNIPDKIGAFENFLNKYLPLGKISDDIHGYYFDSALQEKYQSLEQFYKVYNEENFISVIGSVQKSGGNFTFSKTYSGVTDSKAVYSAVKNFLGGKL